MDLKEKVLEYKDEVVKEIQNAVRVKSVKEAPLPGMPFGEGPAKALDHFMNLAEKLGFKAEKFDNYAMHIDMGEGKETLGILAHVDVVPEGDNWTYPPYSGTIADGKIYGRGTLDDKGPAIISLFAMKAIADSGIKLNKKIRMILGADEESGSACLKYYFGELKMPYPDIAFTPDSSFPVTYAEKGSVRVKIKKKFSTLKDVVIKGGNAFNSVSNEANGVIPVDMLGEVKNKNKVEFVKEGNVYKIFSAGIPAHGAHPEKGYNAISALFEVLKDIEVKNEELKGLVAFFDKFIKMETDGKSFGVKCTDGETGDLTLNLGKINLENNELEIWIDMRVPVKVKNEQIIETIKKNTEDYGYEFLLHSNTQPLYVAKDSFLVSTLMNIYKELTGDNAAQPVAIGGGTYAKYAKNAVAFGALLPDQEDRMHQRDEYLEISKIDKLLQIYVEAIYRLAK
ncbi:xaa-His dipeptidase [Fusobacterium animalis D11]|uniref:Xaa-His dipeptidase n=1 Tax=Fusobacterium animalis D11 TaxID=556264 RepID=D6BIR8_9FUSO|nr:dipeptidase PepV [Fusobacterium nucleatum]EFD82065.1 xaa-His dipeptidase [Fusobacterium animalis D11]